MSRVRRNLTSHVALVVQHQDAPVPEDQNARAEVQVAREGRREAAPLFARTVAGNITYGLEEHEYTTAEVEDAARKAQASEQVT